VLNYNSAQQIRSFLEQHGLGMRKKYGQNFLINPGIRQSLTDALDVNYGDDVWEIGPGLGVMTAILLEKGCKVRAFEIDPGFSNVLKNIFHDKENFTLIEGDVMKTWSLQNNSQETSPQYLLGNLPYNIAAALLANFIEKGCFFNRMVVTVQKETALRMAAAAGSPDYSSFSVLCTSFYRVKPLMLIRPSSFYPKPNVDSMGVLLENKSAGFFPAVFFLLVRSLFASRRKTIKNNLNVFIKSLLSKSSSLNAVSAGDLCACIFSENNLTGRERAEELTPEVFLSLAKSIENMRLYR
jgi:16S rRNA (adenine1518-N6/adenine1519-N6)-dimethyltransferase